MSRIGNVRRSQLITTYGVGAIIAVDEESVMVAGIDNWPIGAPDVHERRLERKLGVKGFVRPPASGKDGGRDIPVVRFPMVYSCPDCHRLAPHRFLSEQNRNKCNRCDAPLIPSRFIMACDKGHIDDFPYFEWVHVGNPPIEGQKHELSIETTGASASLADINIKCSCGLSATMQGAFGKNALKGIKKCTGRRPWLGDKQDDCTAVPRTLQRGASNVYFPVVQSALSIPPWSDGIQKIITRLWTFLNAVPDDALLPTIRSMNLVKGTPYSAEDFVEAVRQRKMGDDGQGISDVSLRLQEYDALMQGRPETSQEQDFVCVSADEAAVGEVSQWFDQVMLTKRLREVRALESFTRLLPPSPADAAVGRRAELTRTPVDWLPAIEVLGEGIFLRLNEDRVKQWEEREIVQTRAARIDTNYRKRFATFGAAPDRQISPRRLLIHTLAHVLITEWSLECGYPAASLRERLYVSNPDDDREMFGLLIYTATTDSAGSLGGIVAQARPGRLGAALSDAIHRASWCSSDPLCIEADAAGVDSLNLAACHACLLLPEVSCEESNLLLDRALLVGTPDQPDLAFFEGLIARNAS